MIELTRLNGSRFAVNCDLIKYSESSPDTMLTLVTGEKLLVSESREYVSAAILAFRAKVLHTAWPGAAAALGATHAQNAQDAIEHRDRSTGDSSDEE